MIITVVKSLDETSSRTRRFLELARELSRNSDFPRVKIGAVIANGTSLISTGWNQKKTHPLQAKYNAKHRTFCKHAYLHAELSAITRSLSIPRQSTLYVYREGKRGQTLCSIPCESCRAAIREAGIDKVICT